MKLSALIKQAAELIESLGDAEVFATIYTTDDVDISTDSELSDEDLDKVIEILNTSNNTEDSIKDMIESAICELPEPVGKLSALNPNPAPYTTTSILYKSLTSTEVLQYQEWARMHYVTGTAIKHIWHPVVQAECEVMNKAHNRPSFYA
jgi:hypothetical protein